LALQLTSLVEQDSRPGEHELGFVLLVVVSAEQQFVVPAIRDGHTDQHIGAGAAPIAPIGSCKCHLMPPCCWSVLVGKGFDSAFACPCQCQPWLVEVSIALW